MAVHGTENYVYYTDKVLGAGSTGTVYFGRHKVTIDTISEAILFVNKHDRKISPQK